MYVCMYVCMCVFMYVCMDAMMYAYTVCTVNFNEWNMCVYVCIAPRNVQYA